MHDRTVCIRDRSATSDNLGIAKWLATACALLIVGASLSGCSQAPPPAMPGQKAPEHPGSPADASPQTAPTLNGRSYPSVPQVVTYDSLQSLLAGYRPHPVVLCFWRADASMATAALREVMQWQTRREDSVALGVNLDTAGKWQSAVVPTLAKAGVRFPCVVVAAGQQERVLRWCGMETAPQGPRIVLLDDAGSLVSLGRPVRPNGRAEGVASRPTTQPAREEVEPPTTQTTAVSTQAAATSQAVAEQEHTVLILYSLQLVRLKDGAKVSEHRGTVVWQDAARAGGKLSDGGMALRRIGLSRLGQEIASKAGREGAVGICRPKCLPAADGQSTGDAFGQALGEAVEGAGGSIVPLAQVQQVMQKAGVSETMVDLQPTSLRNALGAAFLLRGNLTVSDLGKASR